MLTKAHKNLVFLPKNLELIILLWSRIVIAMHYQYEKEVFEVTP